MPSATPTVAYGYPQFPQVYPQLVRGYECVDTAFTGCPGPQLWITAGWYGRTMDSPNWRPSEMDCSTKHPQVRLPRRGGPYPARAVCVRRGHAESAAQGPYYPARFSCLSRRVMIAITTSRCDSPHLSEVNVLVKGD